MEKTLFGNRLFFIAESRQRFELPDGIAVPVFFLGKTEDPCSVAAGILIGIAVSRRGNVFPYCLLVFVELQLLFDGE